jgi:23S rRNA pseudouridine955/2504/2580 synthase
MTAALGRTVAPEDAEMRLDRWFRREFPDLTHGRLEKLLRTGQVRVDGRRAKAGQRLQAGQIVRVPPMPAAAPRRPPETPAPAAPGAAEAEALRDRVLYRDDTVIAIDKPAGLAVQGGTGQRRHLDAMLDALRFGAAERPRLVHRLDRDTSGVLLLARSAAAARKLTEAFRGKAARKVYWALVIGTPPREVGRIDLPLAKGGGVGREKVGAAAGGQPAVTLYRAVATRRVGGGASLTWLVLMPLTGRTHQLRAHCAALGAPILGDGKYGGRAAFPALPAEAGTAPPERLALHARELALPHPEDGTTLRVTCPLPPPLAALWRRLDLDPAAGEGAAAALADLAQGQNHSPPGTRPRRRKSPAAKAGKTRGRR